MNIEILTPAGHLVLTWDPSIAESVTRAQGEFGELVKAGYQFFRVENGHPEASFSSEAGALVVKRVDPEDVAPSVQEQPQTGRRGRPRLGRIVATRPLRGG